MSTTSSSDEAICGAECTDGSPCQNPAGSCGIPTHNDPGAENPQGRPSKLADREQDILTGARQGMTLAGCARLAGVPEQTLHRWKTEYEGFRESLNRARAQGELKHLQSVNDAGSRFILERSFGYVKTEKREISGDPDGAPLNVTISREPYQGDSIDGGGDGE